MKADGPERNSSGAVHRTCSLHGRQPVSGFDGSGFLVPRADDRFVIVPRDRSRTVPTDVKSLYE